MQRKNVIIVGYGHAAVSTAAILGQSGLQVIIINPFAKYTRVNGATRLIALSLSSINLFRKHALLNNITEIAEPIAQIEVSQWNKNGILVFDPTQIDENNFGYMIDEEILWHNLHNHVSQLQNVSLLQDNIETLDINKHGVTLKLSSGQVIKADILIAADGKNSLIREKLHFELDHRSYNQIAIVCDIKHENHHKGIARELFMRNGPFATLPKLGGFTSSVVWTESIDSKELFQSTTQELLEDLIQSRCKHTLGKIELMSQPSIFPLSLVCAKKGFTNRTALVADAWHSIHPLAGQGLNLGLRDIDQLTSMIINQAQLGLDIGDDNLLQSYNAARKNDITMLIEGMDFINNLYSSTLPFMSELGKLAIRCAEQFSPLRKILMSYASTGRIL